MIRIGDALPRGRQWALSLRMQLLGSRRLRFNGEGVDVLDIQAIQNLVIVLARFDFSPNPLMLTAQAADQDELVLHYQGHRLALYVNGCLVDEEWPAGVMAESVCNLCELNAEWLSDFEPVASEGVSTFVWRQGWQPEGVNMSAGDCMPFADGDTFHLFYLRDRRNHQSKWGKGAHQWAHIATKDLVHWQEYPDAICLTDENEGSICTGSVMKCGDEYRAYYAVRMADGSPAKITWARSTDLIHFEKSGEYFELQAPYEPVSARDPLAYYDEEEKRYHLLITTSLVKENGSFGALADYVSEDLVFWHDESPLVVFDADAGRNQPACADLFCSGDLWYLLYRDPQRVNRYFYADGKRGPWNAPENNLIVDRGYIVPKSTVWKGRILFAGFRKPEGCFYGGGIWLYEAVPDGKGNLCFKDIAEMEMNG